MRFEYKTVDISKMTGLKKAEALQRQGWKFTVLGIDKLQFYREAAPKKSKKG